MKEEHSNSPVNCFLIFEVKYALDTCTWEMNKVDNFFIFFLFAVTRSGQLQLCCPSPSSLWWSVVSVGQLQIFPGHVFYNFGVNAQ